MSTPDMRAHFDAGAANRAVSEGLVAGLRAHIEHVLAVSQQRVPVVEGDLKATGYTDVDPDTLVAVAGYGGAYPESIKAVVNHEDMTRAHPGGGQPKFLETAFTGEAASAEGTIGAAVRART